MWSTRHHIIKAFSTHTAVTLFLTANEEQLKREELETQKEEETEQTTAGVKRPEGKQ
jgi:hypothetical protein